MIVPRLHKGMPARTPQRKFRQINSGKSMSVQSSEAKSRLHIFALPIHFGRARFFMHAEVRQACFVLNLSFPMGEDHFRKMFQYPTADYQREQQ